jgi:hypothetical protein
MCRSWERRPTVEWGRKTSGGGSASIRVPMRGCFDAWGWTLASGGGWEKGEDLLRSEGEAQERQGEEGSGGARAAAKSGAEREQGRGLALQPCGGGEGEGSGRHGTLMSKGPRPVVARVRRRRQRSGARRRAEERREEGGSGRVGPIWKREGARGSRLEHVGRPRRRKELGRAQENNADFDLKRISKLNTI